MLRRKLQRYHTRIRTLRSSLVDIEKIKLEAEQRDRDGNAAQNIKDKESEMRKN